MAHGSASGSGVRAGAPVEIRRARTSASRAIRSSPRASASSRPRARRGQRLELPALLRGRSGPAASGRRWPASAPRPCAPSMMRGAMASAASRLPGAHLDVHQRAPGLPLGIRVLAAEREDPVHLGAGSVELPRVEIHLGPDRGDAGPLDIGCQGDVGVLLGAVEEAQPLEGAAHLGRADPRPPGHLGTDLGRAVAAGEHGLEEGARASRGRMARHTAGRTPGSPGRSRGRGCRVAAPCAIAKSTAVVVGQPRLISPALLLAGRQRRVGPARAARPRPARRHRYARATSRAWRRAAPPSARVRRG